MRLLQEEIEKIEVETMEERVLHAEVVDRFEQRRAAGADAKPVEDGHPRPARTVTRDDESKMGGPVVSDFVHQVLQDNTELRSGVAELRGMLLTAHEETEHLRAQLLHDDASRIESSSMLRTAMLADSLALELSRAVSREGPTHRHGLEFSHLTNRLSTSRNRQRRDLSNSDSPTSPLTVRSGQIRPTSRGRGRTASPSLPVVSRQSGNGFVASPPLNAPNRWSARTTSTASMALSSFPSTPRSSVGYPSVFDAMVHAHPPESRPTSPESCLSLPMTPKLRAPSLLSSDSSQHSESAATCRSASGTGSSTPRPRHRPPIVSKQAGTTDHLVPYDRTDDLDWTSTGQVHALEYQKPLRRATSHESILSVSGINPNTLRDEPAQRFVAGRGFLPRLLSSGPSASAGSVSNHLVAGAMTSTARAPSTGTARDSSAYNRNLLQSCHRSSTLGSASPAVGVPLRDVLGGTLGDWAWSRWSGKGKPVTAARPTKVTTSSASKPAPSLAPAKSTTNVNAELKTGASITTTEVNFALLKEALLE